MITPENKKIISSLRKLVSFHRQIGISSYPRNRDIDRFLKATSSKPGKAKAPLTRETAQAVPSPAPRKKVARQAPPPRPAAPPPAPDRQAALARLMQDISSCRKCPRQDGRKAPLASSGPAGSGIMVVLDYPRPEDEAAGIFPSGEEGELFERMLAAIGLDRSQIFLSAMTRCVPGEDRPPSREECLACQPWLLKEIQIVKPRLILAMGAATAAIFAGKNQSLATLRGKFFKYAGIEVIASHPPATLLSQPERKTESWHDLKLVKTRLD